MLRLALLVLLAAPAVRAHDVPIPPSACAFDTIEVAFPALAEEGTAVAPGPADALRILYVPGRQVAQFDAAGVPARSLVGLAAGSLAFPAAFEARMLASGDLTATDVPLVLTVGGTEATVPVTLTTGLAAAAGVVAAGSPLDPVDGRLVLAGVAVADGLPGSLDGATAVFRLSCPVTPVPDLDQYPIVTTTGLAGRITRNGLRLRASVMPGALAPDFAGLPALLDVTAGDTTLAVVDFPGGLPAKGSRTFVARSADGTATLRVHLRRRRPTAAHTLAVRVRGAITNLPDGRPTVTVRYRVGGLLSRVARPFRRTGSALRAP
jgi:hypothetical protein